MAAHCDVNLRAVIRWIDKGHRPGYKLPGRGNNRVRLVDSLNFVERHGIPLPTALHCYGNRVLVVDDEPSMASRIARTLAKPFVAPELVARLDALLPGRIPSGVEYDVEAAMPRGAV